MNTYKIMWEGVVAGFFSDTRLEGVEYLEAKTEFEAHNKAKAKAKQHSGNGYAVIIKDIKKLNEDLQ